MSGQMHIVSYFGVSHWWRPLSFVPHSEMTYLLAALDQSLISHTVHLSIGQRRHVVTNNKSDVTSYESSYAAINIKIETNAVCALFIMTSLHPYLQDMSWKTRWDTSSLPPKHLITDPALHFHNEYEVGIGN